MTSETMLTVLEAAKYKGCSSQWIRTLLSEGRLPGAVKMEGTWRIPRAVLDAVPGNGKPSNLVSMRSLLPGTPEWEQFWNEYPQRLRWTDPKYQTALLDEITELRGEVSRLNFRLGQIADVVQHAAELAQDATAEEGARILEKQTAPERVSHE